MIYAVLSSPPGSWAGILNLIVAIPVTSILTLLSEGDPRHLIVTADVVT